MHIGSSIQTNAFAFLRPPGIETAGQAEQNSLSASVSLDFRSRHHDHGQGHRVSWGREGQWSDESRMEARMERLSAMLQRWAEQNPAAQGAAYAAIVSGGSGGPVASTMPSDGSVGDTLNIQAQSISDVTTSARNDLVSLKANSVTGIYTGAGSDAVAIVANVVSGIHTDAAGPAIEPPPLPLSADELPSVAAEPIENATVVSGRGSNDAEDSMAGGTSAVPSPSAGPIVAGNDALSIAAYLISDISTGEGNDALALSGRSVSKVDAGAGNDAIAIRARVVSGISAGNGNDAIAVVAKAGLAGISNAMSWFAVAADQVVSTNGEVTASVGAAAKAYADIDGGAGNDVISVRTASVIAVAGGVGDDVVNVQGGTVSLLYGAQDGNDTINVAEGAQVVLQIADDVTDYSVSFGDNSMTVTMGEGSVTFAGIGAGTIGIKHGSGGIALITQPGATSLDLAI